MLNAQRDANPFFHLAESLHMLAGRDDAGFLDHYVHDFGSRFGETNGTIHGAYGYRWRTAFGVDQLDAVVKKLRKNPGDRQAVISMWDPRNQSHETEFLGTVQTGENDLLGEWRDRPCNTHAYLRVRGEAGKLELNDVPYNNRVLDLTICCRSNDVIFGAYGANAVHFSVLQEYLAGRIGVGVGRMYQLSNNLHGYVEALDRIGDPVALLEEGDPYERGDVAAAPIGACWEEWDDDLKIFMKWHGEMWMEPDDSLEIDFPDGVVNDWFLGTAAPVCQSNWLWRHGRRQEGLDNCHNIEASDWRQACREWMQRRLGVER